jgi:cyclopropane fatty-acyl-phospholipid synthase-like methyltransferase
MQTNLAELKAEYAQLRARLKVVGWISQGYVQDRGPGAGGPCYQWTRKVKAKTVSVALSKEQYEALQQAIENWHELQETLKRMQQLSRLMIFQTLPNPARRKRLSKKVLGLI